MKCKPNFACIVIERKELMKKILKLLSSLIILSIIVTNAFASEVSFGNTKVESSVLSVNVLLDSVPSDLQDVSAISIEYQFNEEKLEYISDETAFAGSTIPEYKEGFLAWYDSYSGQENTLKITNEMLTEKNNVLFTVNFKILEDAYGTADIEITFIELADSTFAVSKEVTTKLVTIDLGGTPPDGGNDNNNPDSGDDDEGDTGTDGETGSGDDTTGGDDNDDGTTGGDNTDDGTTGGDSGNEGSGDSGSDDGATGDSGNNSTGNNDNTGSKDDGGNKGNGKRPSSSGPSFSSPVVTTPVVTPVFSGFADLAEANWAYTYAYSLMNKGIISGDGSAKPAVRPSDNITREEAAKIALLAMGIEPEAGLELAFADSADVSEWAKPYIATAVKHGVLSGYEDNTVRSKNYITREEMVTILARAMKWQTADAELTFADSGDVAQWSRPNIAYAVANGVMNGYEDNTIKPKATITRAETFALVDRCMK